MMFCVSISEAHERADAILSPSRDTVTLRCFSSEDSTRAGSEFVN